MADNVERANEVHAMDLLAAVTANVYLLIVIALLTARILGRPELGQHVLISAITA